MAIPRATLVIVSVTDINSFLICIFLPAWWAIKSRYHLSYFIEEDIAHTASDKINLFDFRSEDFSNYSLSPLLLRREERIWVAEGGKHRA